VKAVANRADARSDDPDSVRRGGAAVRERSIPPKEQNVDFPILLDDGQISTSTSESTIYADFNRPRSASF
jgi:hypothetical protein